MVEAEPMSAREWRGLTRFAERDPPRRAAGSGSRTSCDGFREAAASRSCRGFAVGRTIFQEPSRRWLAGDIDDDTLIRQTRAIFEALIAAWRETRSARVSQGVSA
jgi:5-dehydro-2-deoxygluconokinase